jgi:hypothetical protein
VVMYNKINRGRLPYQGWHSNGVSTIQFKHNLNLYYTNKRKGVGHARQLARRYVGGGGGRGGGAGGRGERGVALRAE